MTSSASMRQFVITHLFDDTSRLLLSAHRYPDMDMTSVVEQIEARRRIRTKLPEWYSCADVVMSGRIPAEQCSSELTARFKRSIMLSDARSLCDMTGGMGVDFWYMSQGLEVAYYTERQSELCVAARHNFEVLAASASESESGMIPCRKIHIREGLSTALPIPDVDVIFLDPARRSEAGARIYEISDCEPDAVAWQDELLKHCRQLIIKVSPMADISRTLSRLRNVTDVYVLSVRNECKELLIVQQPDALSSSDACSIHCIDYLSSSTVDFTYVLSEAATLSSPALSERVCAYFYEPDVSIMKSQGFAPLSAAYNLSMMDTDCHYFTSDSLVPTFPGRVFAVDEVIDFSSRNLRQLKGRIPKANIAARSFPLSADQLRQRTGIADGGDEYLFGAKLHGVGPVLVHCHKLFH